MKNKKKWKYNGNDDHFTVSLLFIRNIYSNTFQQQNSNVKELW